MRKLLTTILMLLFFISAFSQYGNEWINFSQKYCKFPISSEGIYRIDRDYLVSIDNSFSVVNPKTLQVFVKGKEIPIYIEGANDFSFDSGDYLQFYAKPNDAWLDTSLFDNQADLTNPYYSYFNDTIYYFITWEISPTPKKRLTIETDTFFTNYTQLNYCIKKKTYQYTNSYYWGATNPKYTVGEGWFDNNIIEIGSAKNKSIDITNYTSNMGVKFKCAVAGVPATYLVSNLAHWLKIDCNATTYADEQYTGYNVVKPEFVIPVSQISSSNLILNFSSNSQTGQADRNAISFIDVEFSHNYNFENKANYNFILPQTTNSKNSIEITNFSGSAFILDITSNKIIPSYTVNGNYRAVIPNGTLERQMFITNTITTINNIEKVNFIDYENTNRNTEFVIITNKKLEQQALNYNTYRNAKYKSTIFYVNELYEQFSYGVNKHPIAIRNFLKYISDKYDNLPKAVLLLGKSLHARLYRQNSTNYNICLVPSFGNPSSDNLFTSKLGSSILEPLIPIGRIAAKDNNDVSIYLNKLQQYESVTTTEWQKNIIHFGGGKTISEQNTFASYLNNYENIIEDTLTGSFVSTFLKTSSQPIQITQTDSISHLIENGVSMMTFFGHGSSTGFDQNIDNPSVYNNNGKYGLMLVNSCLAGDIHVSPTGETSSEEWVLINNKGVIGFLADVDLGLAYYLKLFSSEIYKNIAYKNYRKTIGECIKYTIKELKLNNPDNQYIDNVCLDFTFHGDPTVIYNSAENPDLIVTQSSINFNPSYITTEIDSFDVDIIITNIGRVVTDTFVLEVKRTFPDETEDIKVINVYGSFYKDTVSIRFPIDKIKGPGFNTFCVSVDALYQINEIDETNNSACSSTIIISGDLTPIWPYKYTIYPYDTVTLKASTGDPFLQSQINVFEIDTTDTYDSPFKKIIEIVHEGGVVKWHLPFTLTENTVYYWRVSKKNSNSWKESSFIYIEGKTGWSQAHLFQFKNNEYKYIEFDRPNRKFNYITAPSKLQVWDKGSPTVAETYDIKYRIEAISDGGVCGASNAITVVILDSLTLEPWLSNRGDFGHRNYPKCWSSSVSAKYYDFSTDSTSLEKCAQLINSVPTGDYIVVYTVWDAGFQQWPENLYQAFESLFPASSVRYIPNNFPYIFFTKKGVPTISQEIIGASTTSEIYFEKDINTNFNFGDITSEIAGPALNWDTFVWEWKNSETNSYDSTRINLSGVKLDGTESVLISNIATKDSIIYNLNNYVDANEYPYIKLNIYSKDDTLKTPSQIVKWQLTHEQVPETAINPEKSMYFFKDSVQEGDDIIFSVATENVSKYDMDSLLIKYFVKDRNNNVHLIKEKRCRPHPSHDILIDTVSFNTLGYAGLNSIWIEVNPVNSNTNHYDQLEQYHFNNIAQKYFYVNRDIMNPMLDITFNGIHILDGDIVSAKPEIMIKLKDENMFLELNDPSVFKVYLKQPNIVDEVIINNYDSLGTQQLFWTPAELPKNSCKLLYTPELLKDGMYQLRVSATDMSNNESGKYDYLVNFMIENKPTITNVFNYPNPFSTSTSFVFTLTGSQIPEEFIIEIMTISGKLVKVIDLSELGSIRIGKNITDYSWDGTDMYGDRLANGVYFYRVRTKLNGSDIEKRETNTDKFFKKAWGKLYIMR